MAIARRIRVTGRVQGVFFRQWTSERARSLGVAGWVRNERDGSVAAHLQGERQAVEQLVALMGEGPSGARVDELSVENAELIETQRFEVRH